jgi:hypothetical protein
VKHISIVGREYSWKEGTWKIRVKKGQQLKEILEINIVCYMELAK